MDINFDHIEFSRSNSSKQRKACGECNSFEHTAKMCPNKPCSHCNETGHVSSACEIVKEKNRARNRIENMTPERREKQRERKRTSSMSEEQKEKDSSKLDSSEIDITESI